MAKRVVPPGGRRGQAPKSADMVAGAEPPGADEASRDSADAQDGAALARRSRFAAKLQMLGVGAGLFLLLMLMGLVGLLLLRLDPKGPEALRWLVPMGIAIPVLIGVWLSRRHQYESPSLVWYFALTLAMLLCGAGWAAFLAHILLLPDPDAQSAGLAVLMAEILFGALLFAVDLTVASVYLLGLAVTCGLYFVSAGTLPQTSLLLLMGGGVVAIPLIVGWGYRQQRRLLHSVAEVSFLLPRYKKLSHEARHLGEQLESIAAERQQIGQELALTRDAAEAAGVAKTEFLATMSHEIRTPLNGIVPILEILRETQLNAEQTEFVTTALNSSHHLLNLINDILDYSKIEAGKLELETIELDIEDLIDSVVSLMKKSAERRGIRLSSKIARNVPKQVRGDPFRLRQILTNLVGNAIKFTSEGGVSVEVNRHASSPREVVLLFAVRDTGIGMSQDVVGHLFQLFSQADASTTRKYGGTGLGLVICKRLVELMSGRIGVKSEVNKGSVFWFVVPMRKALAEVPSARKSLQGARVLLAGFDELEQQRLSGYLSEWGMLHEQAGNSMEALTKLKASAKLGTSWSYDVLIVDAQTMGGGLAGLVQDIRKLFELSELVILAVDSFPSVAAVIKDAGAGEVVPRPVQEQELRNRLCRLLDVQTYKSGKTRDNERRILMPDAAFNWGDGGERRRDSRGEQGPAAAASPTAAVRRSETAGRDPLVGHILVVEDNPVNLAVVRKLLERFGLTSDTAGDGLEALAAIKANQYDLVLMDMQMPNMDGYEATGEIRKREAARGLARMPVLAMTANAMAGDREKCLDAGMDDYMSKPIKPAELNTMLRNWLPLRDAVERDSAGAEAPRVPAQDKGNTSAPASTASPADGSVLDHQVLEELFEIMEAGTGALLQEYLNNAPKLLANVAKAAQSGDAQAMVLPAHSLKSSSANVGAMKVSEIAKRLEFMGREDDMQEARKSAQAIASAYAEAERELTTIIERGSLV